MRNQELFYSPELDEWAKKNKVTIKGIVIHVMDKQGELLFQAETSYPLPKKLTIEGMKLGLSELWFNGRASFAIYDSTGRIPVTRRLIIH